MTPRYKLHTPIRKEDRDFMFFVNQDTGEAVGRASKVDLAIALGAPDKKDCPWCNPPKHTAPRVNL